MSAPTGMGRQTAAHWLNVNAELQRFVHSNNQQHLYDVQGHVNQFQPTHGVAFATNTENLQPGKIARQFLRNLFNRT
ncbi:hypothetical protein I4U23_011085 [Adineta vaga]|nr:hypothetical protein I4U23_011085 [Adineta vaga]